MLAWCSGSTKTAPVGEATPLWYPPASQEERGPVPDTKPCATTGPLRLKDSAGVGHRPPRSPPAPTLCPSPFRLCRGDQGEIKIINNNNHLLGPLQNRIAMATACWQRCCLVDGKRLPGTDANSSNATPVQRVAVQGQAR